MTTNNDFIYWTFSAAAQSISAFIAFLISGYAIVHNIMENTIEKDPTLMEIIAILQKKYHRQLGLLASVTGTAIILSLLVVFFNRQNSSISPFILLFVGLVDLATIAFGLAFVISIIRPGTFQAVAIDELKKETGNKPKKAVWEFFDAFRELETQIRLLLEENGLYKEGRSRDSMKYSFRQKVQALVTSQLIDPNFANQLFEINKIRNLVFHGNVNEIDKDIVLRTIDALHKINSMRKKKKSI
jgi:hypothetical protein